MGLCVEYLRKYESSTTGVRIRECEERERERMKESVGMDRDREVEKGGVVVCKRKNHDHGN